MAKKKLTRHSTNHEQEPPQPQHFTEPLKPSRPMTVDDASEKLQSLRNLNSLLLKETTELRQKVESLVEANEALESAFNRSSTEQKLLESHISNAAEENVALDMEKGVVSVFMEAQMREMGFQFEKLASEKNEILLAVTETWSHVAILKGEFDELKVDIKAEKELVERLSDDREQIKNALDCVVAEGKRLTGKLNETENRERKLKEEVEKLTLQGENLMEEACEKERAIGKLKLERDLALKKSANSASVIDELMREMDVIMREKSEAEKLNETQELKIIDLESELKQLNESLENLLKEETLMCAKILDLEDSLGLAVDKEKEMAMEIRALLKQKNEMEESLVVLAERRDSIQKVLDTVQKELEDKQHEIDETIRAKYGIEQLKVIRETEIVELQREVERLYDVEHKLKETCRDFEEKNKHLLCEVICNRNSLEEVKLERDNIRKGFDEEKNKVKSLMLQVARMGDKIVKSAVELGQVRSERGKLIEKNEVMECNVGILKKEKEVLQQNLLEAQRVSEDLKAKIEFCCINSNQALAMLKSTAALLCHYKDCVVEEVASNEQKPKEEEIQPYAEQLEAIKNAFINKNKMVADMKQQLASMQNSVAEARKMKSLWTVISSATTILAAALAAYVARGR